MKDGNEHLTSETLQRYVEGELDEGTGREAARHLAECRRCAAELEGWSLLFRELDELPAVEPSEAFRDRVVSQLPREPKPAGTPLPERLRSLVGGLLSSGRPVRDHVSPEGMQALLDGALRGRTRRRVEAHVAACEACGSELESWQAVFADLDELPSLAPPTGFAERVMANVRMREAPAPEASWEPVTGDLRAWAGRLLPSTRKGWALAGGVAGAPAVGMVAVVVAIVAHPLLTLGSLAAFLWWRAGDALSALGSGLVAWAVEMPALASVHEIAEGLLRSPGLAAAGLGALWCITLAAGWILYRNVLSTHVVAERHVR